MRDGDRLPHRFADDLGLVDRLAGGVGFAFSARWTSTRFQRAGSRAWAADCSEASRDWTTRQQRKVRPESVVLFMRGDIISRPGAAVSMSQGWPDVSPGRSSAQRGDTHRYIDVIGKSFLAAELNPPARGKGRRTGRQPL